jgi:hypothetical protein
MRLSNGHLFRPVPTAHKALAGSGFWGLAPPYAARRTGRKLKGFPLALPLVNQSKQQPTRCVLPAINWSILSIHSCYYLRVSVVLFCPGQTLLNAHCADSSGIMTRSISGGIAEPLLSVYGQKHHSTSP